MVSTKVILFFRGLCRDNLHCYMKDIYCGLHRGNLYYGFRRGNLYYGLDSESLSYGFCRDNFYCGPIFVVEFTAIVFIIAFAERFFTMAFAFGMALHTAGTIPAQTPAKGIDSIVSQPRFLPGGSILKAFVEGLCPALSGPPGPIRLYLALSGSIRFFLF